MLKIAPVLACFSLVLFSMALVAQPAKGENGTKALQGWAETRWGMTESEVVAAMAGKVAMLPKPESFDLTKHGGKICLSTVAIEDFDISGMIFKVWFAFEGYPHRLAAVILSAKEKNSSIAENHYYHLKRLLIEKYGPATISHEKKEAKLIRSVSLDSTWNLSATTIDLHFLFIDIPNMDPYLNVTYMPITAIKSRTEGL